MTFSPPSSELLAACERFQDQAAAIGQVFADLTYAQRWEGLTVQEHGKAGFCLLMGRPKPNEPERFVFPCPQELNLSTSKLKSIFNELGEEVETIVLAIVSTDSSTVYYELRRGIVSPKEVPD